MNISLSTEITHTSDVISPIAHSGEIRQYECDDRVLIYSEYTGCPFRVALGISTLFLRAYGTSYHKTVTSDPSSVKAMIDSGRWIAAVVTDSDGDVIAHGALLKGTSSSDDGTLRLARILVDESARGRGLAERITNTLLEEADARFGTTAPIVTEAVTSHPLTQRLFAKLDFSPLAILVGKFNDYFCLGFRESTLLMGRAVTSNVLQVHVPQQLVSTVEEICAWHQLGVKVLGGCERELSGIVQSGSKQSHFCQGGYSTFDPHMRIARASFNREILGELSIDQFLGELKLISDKDPAFTELKIDVASGKGGVLVDLAIEQGFIFAGIEPQKNGFNLLLQRGDSDLIKRASQLKLINSGGRFIQSSIVNGFSQQYLKN